MSKLGTLGVLLAFAAIPAQGQELIFGANVGARWDSNVNNLPNGDSDFSARVGPEVRLRETQGDLTYDLHYVPTYQAYSRFANLDDWDQLVNSTVSYQLGLATSIQFKDIFDYAPVATNFLQQLTSPTGVPLGTQVVNTIGRYNVVVNTASLDLQHRWSELWLSDLTVTSFYYDPRVTDGISSNTTTGSGSLTYAVTQRDYMGGAGSVTSQQFGSNSFQNATTSYFYNISGVWNHEFSPTWSLKMQAGPTYVDAGTVSTASNASVPQFPVSVNGVPALIDFRSCPTGAAASGVPSGRSLLNLCGPPTLLATSLVTTIAGIPVNLPVTSPTPSQLASSTVVPIQGLSQGSQTSLTYFANILMTKRWETVTATLGYSRSAGSSGVFSSSTEADTINGGLVWQASPVWTTSLNVFWTDQSSSSNNTTGFQEIVQPFPYSGFTLNPVTPINTHTPQAAGIIAVQQRGTINVYQWVVGLHSDYRLTKRLSLFGNFFYLNQSSSQQGGQGLNLSNLDYNATRIDLGFHYEFDPIHL